MTSKSIIFLISWNIREFYDSSIFPGPLLCLCLNDAVMRCSSTWRAVTDLLVFPLSVSAEGRLVWGELTSLTSLASRGPAGHWAVYQTLLGGDEALPLYTGPASHRSDDHSHAAALGGLDSSPVVVPVVVPAVVSPVALPVSLPGSLAPLTLPPSHIPPLVLTAPQFPLSTSAAFLDRLRLLSLLLCRLRSLHLDHHQPVDLRRRSVRGYRHLPGHLQGDDQRVLGCAEQVHRVNQPIVDDDNQPKDKKWSVLENDCHQDAPHVKIAANLFGFLASRGIKVHYFVLKVTFYFGQYLTRRIHLCSGHDYCEL